MTAEQPAGNTIHITIHQPQGLVIGDNARVGQQFGDAEAQRRRVEEGVAEQRGLHELLGRARSAGARTQVVGIRPDSGRYFLDRELDRQRAAELLADPSTRLISIVGQGGMGKTALACKVLDELVQGRSVMGKDIKPVDGIVYMSTRTAGISLEQMFQDCIGLIDGDVGQRLIAVWTDATLTTLAKGARLLEALSGGTYVVLLDNLDDLMNAEGELVDKGLQMLIEQSLRSGQGAVLIVTTRRALTLRYDLQALNETMRLDQGLPVEDAVELLRKLDRQGRLSGSSDQDLEEAVAIAHGVPRAVQLIPSILAGYGPGTPLSKVMTRFHRQGDVVRELIEENYRGLTTEARRVMDALAVLRRPVPIVAVDYLLQPFAPGLDVPALVTKLVAWSIVSEDYAIGTVSLHPVDQDYAYSQLADETSAAEQYTRQALERRAAAYFKELRTPEAMWRSIEQLDPQLSEFEHLIRAGDFAAACQVVNELGAILHLWGHYERIIQMRLQLWGMIKDPRLDFGNLRYLGTTYRSLGSMDKSTEFYHQALAVARSLGEDEMIADVLNGLGLVEQHLGHHLKAIEYFNESLELARGVNSKARMGAVLGHLGTMHYGTGRRELARQYYLESLAIAQELGDRRREGNRMNSLGNIARQLGDLDEALEYYRKGLEIAEELGHERGRGNNLDSIGGIFLVQRRWEDATRNYLKALEIARKIGQHRAESHRLIMLAKSALGLGDVSGAMRFCTEALQLDMAENNHVALLVLGISYLNASDDRYADTFAKANAECRRLLEHSPETFWFRYNLATTLVGQATALGLAGDDASATGLMHDAIRTYARALEQSAAKGVLQHVLLDLELIGKTGPDRVKSATNLLNGYLNENAASIIT